MISLSTTIPRDAHNETLPPPHPGICNRVPSVNVKLEVIGLATFAVSSVTWGYLGQQRGSGDLRLHLMLQVAPLVLIPLWQAVYGANRADRLWFDFALMLYVLAKAAEVCDHEMHSTLGWITGHTIKHLLASAAVWVWVARLIRTVPNASARTCRCTPAFDAAPVGHGGVNEVFIE